MLFTNRVFFTQAEKRRVEKEQKPRWFQQRSPLWWVRNSTATLYCYPRSPIPAMTRKVLCKAGTFITFFIQPFSQSFSGLRY